MVCGDVADSREGGGFILVTFVFIHTVPLLDQLLSSCCSLDGSADLIGLAGDGSGVTRDVKESE